MLMLNLEIRLQLLVIVASINKQQLYWVCAGLVEELGARHDSRKTGTGDPVYQDVAAFARLLEAHARRLEMACP
ncbi:hypothetical protein [Roseibium sp. RKSG952]|uniref:hypothetical protein n=1 Tax=Roseibium sp. RKSG952 TaxID=2529384 RepID=UPI0012BCB6CD|nr:hypothetical protein [Roseibium sp. RKSG952]MTI00429.1 hypothetical protein [Roseibium sp. RKSG952]